MIHTTYEAVFETRNADGLAVSDTHIRAPLLTNTDHMLHLRESYVGIWTVTTESFPTKCTLDSSFHNEQLLFVFDVKRTHS